MHCKHTSDLVGEKIITFVHSLFTSPPKKSHGQIPGMLDDQITGQLIQGNAEQLGAMACDVMWYVHIVFIMN